jgi:hypothetical protein
LLLGCPQFLSQVVGTQALLGSGLLRNSQFGPEWALISHLPQSAERNGEHAKFK